MKKIYSIGYTHTSGVFLKVMEDCYTMKFATIEEAENYAISNIKNGKCVVSNKPIKIMKGWEVIKEII